MKGATCLTLRHVSSLLILALGPLRQRTKDMDVIRRIHNQLSGLVPEDRRNKHLSFFLVLMGAFLDNFNVCGSLAVYDSIIEKFDTDVPKASWTLSAYSLTLGAFIMLGGKLTDILGPRVVFLSGLFLTSLLALICAAIDDQIIVLIVFRALQGMTASVMVPSMFPIAYSYYSDHGMGGALIAIMAVLTNSNGAGLIVGGAFSLTGIGYKGLYYFTFALAFSISVILYFIMYPVPVHHDNQTAHIKNLDWPGTAILIVGILLVVLGLTEGGESWKKPSAYVPIPIGVLVIALGLYFELGYIQDFKNRIDEQKRVTDTEKTDSQEITSNVEADWRYNLHMILPRDSFKITNFFPWFFGLVLLFMCFVSFVSLSVQYYQYIDGDNSLMAGLKALPMSIGLTVGALANRESLIYRLNMKRVVIASQVASVGLIVWASYHNPNVKNSYWIFDFVPLFGFGFLTNTFFGVYVNAVMRNTPGHLQGVVSGMFQTGGQIGICLGNSIIATLLGAVSTPHNATERASVTSHFHHSYYLVIALQAAVVMVLVPLKNQSSVIEGSDKPEEKSTADSEVDIPISVSEVV